MMKAPFILGRFIPQGRRQCTDADDEANAGEEDHSVALPGERVFLQRGVAGTSHDEEIYICGSKVVWSIDRQVRAGSRRATRCGKSDPLLRTRPRDNTPLADSGRRQVETMATLASEVIQATCCNFQHDVGVPRSLCVLQHSCIQIFAQGGNEFSIPLPGKVWRAAPIWHVEGLIVFWLPPYAGRQHLATPHGTPRRAGGERKPVRPQCM